MTIVPNISNKYDSKVISENEKVFSFSFPASYEDLEKINEESLSLRGLHVFVEKGLSFAKRNEHRLDPKKLNRLMKKFLRAAERAEKIAPSGKIVTKLVDEFITRKRVEKTGSPAIFACAVDFNIDPSLSCENPFPNEKILEEVSITYEEGVKPLSEEELAKLEGVLTSLEYRFTEGLREVRFIKECKTDIPPVIIGFEGKAYSHCSGKYDYLEGAIKLERNFMEGDGEGRFTHEVGHHVFHKIPYEMAFDWKETGENSQDLNDYISNNARVNSNEDFSETFANFLVYPFKFYLRGDFPKNSILAKKYEWVWQNLFCKRSRDLDLPEPLTHLYIIHDYHQNQIVMHTEFPKDSDYYGKYLSTYEAQDLMEYIQKSRFYPDFDVTDDVKYLLALSLEGKILPLNNNHSVSPEEAYPILLETYKNLAQDYPSSVWVKWAELGIGRSLRGLGKYQEAINQFQTILEKYPDSEISDNAQFEIAITYNLMSWQDESNETTYLKQAILEYAKFLTLYPNSPLVEDVRMRMESNFRRFIYLKRLIAYERLINIVNYPSPSETNVNEEVVINDPERTAEISQEVLEIYQEILEIVSVISFGLGENIEEIFLSDRNNVDLIDFGKVVFETLFYIGETYKQRGKKNWAKFHYLKAVELLKNPIFRIDFIRALWRRGRDDLREKLIWDIYSVLSHLAETEKWISLDLTLTNSLSEEGFQYLEEIYQALPYEIPLFYLGTYCYTSGNLLYDMRNGFRDAIESQVVPLALGWYERGHPYLCQILNNPEYERYQEAAQHWLQHASRRLPDHPELSTCE